jgi:hypothetical protein
VAFIRAFHGRSLCVKNCPSFDNEVLSITATPKYYCASELKELSISNCPNISIPALKQWWKQDATTPKIGFGKYKVSGRIPEISLEDAEWFQDLQILSVIIYASARNTA